MKIGEDRWKDGSRTNQKKLMASKAVRGCHQAPEKWVMGWTSVSLVGWFSQWTKAPGLVRGSAVPRWDAAPIVRRPLSAHVVHSPWRQRKVNVWGVASNCVGSVGLQTYSDLFRLIWSGDIFQSKQAKKKNVMYQSKAHIFLRQKHLGLLDLMQINLPRGSRC